MIVNRLDRRDLERLIDVLAQPDPPEMPRRGARCTQAGDPHRRKTVLLPLMIRWAQYRCLQVDPEPMPARAASAHASRALPFRRRAALSDLARSLTMARAAGAAQSGAPLRSA